MADQEQQGRPETGNEFGKGLNKDLIDTFMPTGSYFHARNATISLPDGNTGPVLHTEPANILEVVLPYTLIGCIQLEGDQWILFTTDNTYSEIGLYTETTGTYVTLLNDVATITATSVPPTYVLPAPLPLPGLNFNTANLITGQARRNFDCGFDVYWSDGGRNPDRMIDTAFLYPNPWVQDCSTVAACVTCTNTNLIDTNAIRMSPQFTIPCLELSKSTNSGLLLNGSYQVCLRFAINGIACTDFVAQSNVMGVFSHNNQAGALILSISGISPETTIIFPEVEIVVVSMVNFQVQAKRLGIYNSDLSTIHIDNLAQELVNIDLKLLPLSTPIIDSCDAIYGVSDYLVKVGVREKPDFNYQLLANQIQVWWVCIEYPDIYYHNGGNNGYPMNVGYMRGEVYSLYNRWDYTTGDKSASYHIPGLPAGTPATVFLGAPPGVTINDGGVIVAYGRMAGYSSDITYPDNEANIWGPLCGQPIMHHRFPDQTDSPALTHFTANGTIRVMGLFLTNVLAPTDNTGALLPNIQGYEILRDVRNGNASVLAKGMINNMRTYTDSGGEQGIFQNYPYNDLRPDPYLSASVTTVNHGAPGEGLDHSNMLTGYRNDILSFHSPDTVFQHPFLGSGDSTLPPLQTTHLKILMGMSGTTHGKFHEPYKHPLFKVLTNFDSILADFIGLLELALNITQAVSLIAGGNPPEWQFAATESLPLSVPVFAPLAPAYDIDGTDTNVVLNRIIAGLNIATLILLSAIEIAALREQLLTIIKGLIPGRQYAAQYDSSGFYNLPQIGVGSSGASYTINDYSYIKSQVQTFQDLTVNNLYRNDFVALGLVGGPDPTFSLLGDNSRYLISDITNAPNWLKNNGATWLTTGITLGSGPYGHIASYYASYNISQPSQYGGIGTCKQVPIGCMQPTIPISAPASYTSTIQFGGDTYVNRYTEKNPFMFFNDWLVNVPEDFIYDYRNYVNVPYPMFWIDNDVINYTLLGLASDNRRLDGPINLFTGGLFPGMDGKLFYVNTGYFYLFCNGVRDFYVESSVNVGYRDWGDLIQEQYYNPYGLTQDIQQIFRSDIIKSDPVYKYDYSLSADKFFNQYLSWSQCLDRDYNPELAYSCFAYYPRRLAYSLPQEEELRKDNWKVFLPNNYKDLPTRVVAIKDINKTGALILLDDQAPLSWVGVESIPSKSGTDFTVGTGTLFKQQLQSISNVDNSYQYGSCQNRLSVISTPYGVFWCSRNTGKIFHYNGQQLDEISKYGLKYDLSLFMPSQILKQYPTYKLADNPVAGVGIQLIYDSINEIVYICKKDYQVKPFYLSGMHLGGDNQSFTYTYGDITIPVTIGDDIFFDDCSWTLSYDPKKKQFISHHDWVPALSIAAKTHFLTTDTVYGHGNTLWRHNQSTDLFCTYYGQSFPFEVGYPLITGTQVTTLESIEVYLESYLYNMDQVDKFQEYNGFFDYCIIWNSEQATLPMLLTLQPWDDPYAEFNYPAISAAGADVLYTKQEQKYRIGMLLKDFTNDRGQFTLDTEQFMQTSPKWYVWSINPLYLDFFKDVTQLKKIRHYKSRIFLRKFNPGSQALSVYFTKQKLLNSPR